MEQGEQIRTARIQAGLTQDEAVQLIRQHGVKISVSGLRLYERGDGASEEKGAQILAVLTGSGKGRANIGSLLPDEARKILAQLGDAVTADAPSERLLFLLYAFADKLDPTDPDEQAQLEEIKSRLLERAQGGGD